MLSNEVELTGESEFIPKVVLNKDNYKIKELGGVLLAKSECVSGSGKAIVTAVGDKTASGEIDKHEEVDKETDL